MRIAAAAAGGGRDPDGEVRAAAARCLAALVEAAPRGARFDAETLHRIGQEAVRRLTDVHATAAREWTRLLGALAHCLIWTARPGCPLPLYAWGSSAPEVTAAKGPLRLAFGDTDLAGFLLWLTQVRAIDPHPFPNSKPAFWGLCLTPCLAVLTAGLTIRVRVLGIVQATSQPPS